MSVFSVIRGPGSISATGSGVLGRKTVGQVALRGIKVVWVHSDGSVLFLTFSSEHAMCGVSAARALEDKMAKSSENEERADS